MWPEILKLEDWFNMVTQEQAITPACEFTYFLGFLFHIKFYICTFGYADSESKCISLHHVTVLQYSTCKIAEISENYFP